MKIVTVKKLYCIAIAACLTVSIGCGGGNDGKIGVAGAVSYDGQPIMEGTIVFMPLPSKPGTSESTPIVNGVFMARLPEGKRMVQIYGFRPGIEIASLTGGEPTMSKDQYIPDVYNHASTLSVDIAADMPPLVFDLEAGAVPRR